MTACNHTCVGSNVRVERRRSELDRVGSPLGAQSFVQVSPHAVDRSLPSLLFSQTLPVTGIASPVCGLSWIIRSTFIPSVFPPSPLKFDSASHTIWIPAHTNVVDFLWVNRVLHHDRRDYHAFDVSRSILGQPCITERRSEHHHRPCLIPEPHSPCFAPSFDVRVTNKTSQDKVEVTPCAGTVYLGTYFLSGP